MLKLIDLAEDVISGHFDEETDTRMREAISEAELCERKAMAWDRVMFKLDEMIRDKHTKLIITGLTVKELFNKELEAVESAMKEEG